MKPIWEWGGTWVFGITGLVIGVITLWRNRRIPNKIVCRELGKSTLVRIQKEAGDLVAIQFDNKRVGHLALLELILRNTGLENLKDVAIQISFEDQTEILRTTAKMSPDAIGYQIGQSQLSYNQVKLSFPYLNSWKFHKQEILVAIICDGNIGNVRVLGGGSGWTVDYLTLETAGSRSFRAKCMEFTMYVCFVMAALIGLIAPGHTRNTSAIDTKIIANFMDALATDNAEAAEKFQKLRTEWELVAKRNEQAGRDTTVFAMMGLLFLAATFKVLSSRNVTDYDYDLEVATQGGKRPTRKRRLKPKPRSGDESDGKPNPGREAPNPKAGGSQF